MLPLLKCVADGQGHSLRNVIDELASEYRITESERRELLPSGGQFIFDNRVGWARTYLKKAGLLSTPKRGAMQITERGREVLKDHPNKIDNAFLCRFPEFLEFRSTRTEDTEDASIGTSSEKLDPQETIEAAFHEIQKELAVEILARVKTCSPAFFERLVVDLLLKMGYGGSRRDFGRAIGKPGDAGIDAVIKEDKLGLDMVYIQAKRWDNSTVGSKEIQAFVGALHGEKARKGVFITTSDFSKPARNYVGDIQDKVILIDGQELADLLIEYGVGVSTVVSYEIKKVDADYFPED